MILEAEKEKLSINKVITNKKEIIFVEGDMIIPDSKPDILNTICTSGEVCLYKKEVLDEKIKLEGNISTYIMYLSDDPKSKVRGINASLDFSENIEVANCRLGMNSVVNTKLKSIECKVINERKIGIKASLEIEIKLYEVEDVEVINNIQNSQDIQILKEGVKVNSLVGMGETKIYAKETISLENIDNFAEILKVNMSIVNKDVKISYNKVLTKSELEIKILYLTEDDRFNICNASIPVVGFIDIPNVTDDNACDVDYEMRNLVIKPNSSDEHSIYLEAEIGVMVMSYEEKTINLIQDLYSTNENITFNKKQINTIMSKSSTSFQKQIREKIKLDGIDNKSMLDVDIVPIITNQNNMNNRIMCEGELEFKFIMLDNNDMQIEIRNAKLPFEYTIEDIDDPENLNVDSEIEITNKDFIIQDGGDVTSNIDMMINTGTYRNTNLNIIDEIDVSGEREEQDYNIIIYIVKRGDSLWKIAKKFGSTVDDIARVNGIEDRDKIYPGQKLFVPKYYRVGVSSEETSMMEY